jgi:hypothetical protein
MTKRASLRAAGEAIHCHGKNGLLRRD